MIKIGLTGGICSGKSLVLSFFKQLGAYTLKADALSKSILFSDDHKQREKIMAAIGSPVLDGNPLPDKETFSAILFTNPEKRMMINSIVHPLVREARDKLIAAVEKTGKYSLFLYESALLAEAGTYRDFDRILVVYCNPETQLKRLMTRDSIDRQEAETKIKSQMPLSEKLKIAHYTIDTSGSKDNAYAVTLEIFSLIQRDFNIASNLIE